jgi:hypothetical protein
MMNFRGGGSGGGGSGSHGGGLSSVDVFFYRFLFLGLLDMSFT